MGINEIEKMFGNAEVKLVADVEFPTKDVNYNVSYPPFTIKEQIELIKWLARHNFVVYKNLGGWYIGINPTYDEEFGITCSKRATNYDSFEYALASLINTLWQSLAEEEKEQIKEILDDDRN